jgi:hypothetical protein
MRPNLRRCIPTRRQFSVRVPPIADFPTVQAPNPIWLDCAGFLFQNRISSVTLRATRLFPIVRSPRFRLSELPRAPARRIAGKDPPAIPCDIRDIRDSRDFRVTFASRCLSNAAPVWRFTKGGASAPPRLRAHPWRFRHPHCARAKPPWPVRTLGPFGRVANDPVPSASRRRCAIARWCGSCSAPGRLPLRGEPPPSGERVFRAMPGAGCRTRTDDLPLTRRLLYQLS